MKNTFKMLLNKKEAPRQESAESRALRWQSEASEADAEIRAAATERAEKITAVPGQSPARIAGAWLAAGLGCEYAAQRLAPHCQSEEIIGVLMAANGGDAARAVLAMAGSRTEFEAAICAKKMGLLHDLEASAARAPDTLFSSRLLKIIAMIKR